MKKLYSFEVPKETEMEVQVESQNESGETIITKKKEKQKVSHKFFVAKPNRSLIDQGSLFNSVKVSEGLKMGLMSIFSLDKKYREDGVFTEEDNQKYKELYEQIIEVLKTIQTINNVPESERTEEQKVQYDKDLKQLETLRTKLKAYEDIKDNLYTHTAEYRARNLTISWWLLQLAYKEENGKETPFFVGNSIDEKLKSYDDLVEKDDPFIKKVIDRFTYVVSYWMMNQAEKQEDFADLERIISREENPQKEDANNVGSPERKT